MRAGEVYRSQAVTTTGGSEILFILNEPWCLSQVTCGPAFGRCPATQMRDLEGSPDQSLGRRAWFTSRLTAQASATGPRCLSLSGLLTERIVWICPSSTSSVKA